MVIFRKKNVKQYDVAAKNISNGNNIKKKLKRIYIYIKQNKNHIV